MEAEICTKMLRHLNKKHAAKFPETALSYSMGKIARLNDAFSEIFELETSPVEGLSLLQKDKKILICVHAQAKHVIKRGASGKKVMMLLANAVLGRSELIWLISRLKISKMSETFIFREKVQRKW